MYLCAAVEDDDTCQANSMQFHDWRNQLKYRPTVSQGGSGWYPALTQLLKPDLVANVALWLWWEWGGTQAASVSDDKYL